MAKSIEIVSVKFQDIGANLQIGQIYTNKMLITLICCFVMECFVVILGIAISIDDISNKIWICFIMGGIILGIITWLTIRYLNGIKRKVKLWLEDAIILAAKTKKIDTSIACRAPGICLSTSAIQVRFRYAGKEYVKSSTHKGKVYCLHIYNKYADRKILIAYSPKYDQVMLIKPEREQRILPLLKQ